MILIDADALKKEFPKDEDWEYPVNTNEYVCEKIDEQPTIEERKKGKWICKYLPASIGSKVFVEVNICSNCGYVVEGNIVSKFCPVCGCDMRGESE